MKSVNVSTAPYENRFGNRASRRRTYLRGTRAQGRIVIETGNPEREAVFQIRPL